MFCRNCGKQLNDDSKFCLNCGTPVANATEPKAETTAPVTEETAEAAVPAAEVAEEKVAPVPEEPKVEAPAQEAPKVAFEPAPQQAPQAAAQEVPRAYQPAATVAAEPCHRNPVVAALKKASSSPLILITTILYSVVVIGQLFTIFGQSSASIYNEYLYGEAAQVMQAFSSFAKVFSLIGMTPMFLIVAGLWVNYVHARRKNDIATSGLTLVKSAMVVRLVVQFIAIALVLLLLILGVSAITGAMDLADYYYDDYYYYEDPFSAIGGGVIGVYVGIFLVYLVIMAFPIIHEFSALSAIKSMKHTLQTGTYRSKGFGIMVVMNYVYVGIYAIGLLLTLAMESLIQSIFSVVGVYDVQVLNELMASVNSSNSWAMISQIIMIVVLILFSVNLSKHKNNMIGKENIF